MIQKPMFSPQVEWLPPEEFKDFVSKLHYSIIFLRLRKLKSTIHKVFANVFKQ